MSEMVERVAEAIRNTNASTTGLLYSDLLTAMARAAISAMREPTYAMADKSVHAGWSGVIEGDIELELDSGIGLYQAMIDEALK